MLMAILIALLGTILLEKLFAVFLLRVLSLTAKVDLVGQARLPVDIRIVSPRCAKISHRRELLHKGLRFSFSTSIRFITHALRLLKPLTLNNRILQRTALIFLIYSHTTWEDTYMATTLTYNYELLEPYVTNSGHVSYQAELLVDVTVKDGEDCFDGAEVLYLDKWGGVIESTHYKPKEWDRFYSDFPIREFVERDADIAEYEARQDGDVMDDYDRGYRE